MTQRTQEQCHGYKKTSLKWLSSLSWSVVSNAALRPRRVKVEMWSESLLVKRSLKTRGRAVPRSTRRLKSMPQTVVRGVQAAEKGQLFQQFWHKRQFDTGLKFLRILGSGDALFWRGDNGPFQRVWHRTCGKALDISLTISVNTRAISSIHWNSSLSLIHISEPTRPP